MVAMKTIGLIGGMSWESTLVYYRLINEAVARALGGLHSARCVLWSFDFDEIESLQAAGDWAAATVRLVDAGRAVQRAGAEFLVICTNTMHRMADDVERATGLPLVHIADATAERIRGDNRARVGLLGTRFTMEQGFYTGRLRERFGLDVVVPDEAGRQRVHDAIYHGLCRGIIDERARADFQEVIGRFADEGCEAVILGCTEIGLLIQQRHSPLPLYDTTEIHAHAAAAFALGARGCEGIA